MKLILSVLLTLYLCTSCTNKPPETVKSIEYKINPFTIKPFFGVIYVFSQFPLAKCGCGQGMRTINGYSF